MCNPLHRQPSVLVIGAFIESQRFAVSVIPGICGQEAFLYSAYAMLYFLSSLDFAQGRGVRNEIQFDSMINLPRVIECQEPRSLS